MKHIPILLVLFLVAVLGHVIVQADSAVQVRNKPINKNNNDVRDGTAIDGKHLKGRKEQKIIQGEESSSHKVVKSSSSNENKRKVNGKLIHLPDVDEPNNNLKNKKHGRKMEKQDNPESKNHPRHRMNQHRSNSSPAFMQGIISFVCNILKMFKLQGLPFIKTLCPNNSSSATTTPNQGNQTTAKVASTTASGVTSSPTVQTSTTTKVVTTTRDPRALDFSFADGTTQATLQCPGANELKILSAFYGNPKTCGMIDITANMTVAVKGMMMLVMSISSANLGNLCPNSQNTFTGQYYCDTSVTFYALELVVGQGTTVLLTCQTATVKISNQSTMKYVQPSCTVDGTAELSQYVGKNSQQLTIDVKKTSGQDSPPGCKNAFTNMFAQFHIGCS